LFYFTIEPWDSRFYFYIYMIDPQICNMPVKYGLEFMTIISPNGVNKEGKFGNAVVNKSNSVFLGVSVAEFQCSYPSRIIKAGRKS